MARIEAEEAASYIVSVQRGGENDVIAQALAILDARMFRRGEALISPRDSAAFLKLKLGSYQWEVFGVLLALFLVAVTRGDSAPPTLRLMIGGAQ